MFQDGLKEQITEGVVLAPEEANLFFGRQSHKEGLPYTSAMDVRFSLTGPINWARKTVQGEAPAKKCRKAVELLWMLSWRRKQRPGDWGTLRVGESHQAFGWCL